MQIDAQRGDAHLKLADAQVKANDPVNAIKEYIRAADLLPNDADTQLKAAQGLLLAGRYEDARARADKVLERDKQNVTAQILRGNALAGLKDFDGAIAEYEDAVATDPSQHEAFVNLGTVQFLRGNREESEAAFHKAVEAAPQSVEARLSLANFYWASQRPGRRGGDAQGRPGHRHEEHDGQSRPGRVLHGNRTRRGRRAVLQGARRGRHDGVARHPGAVRHRHDRRDEGRKILNDLLDRKDAVPLATVRLAALDAVEGQLAQSEKRLRTIPGAAARRI